MLKVYLVRWTLYISKSQHISRMIKYQHNHWLMMIATFQLASPKHPLSLVFIIYVSQKQLLRKMKPRLVITECAGYIFLQFFLLRLYLFSRLQSPVTPSMRRLARRHWAFVLKGRIDGPDFDTCYANFVMLYHL